MNGQPQPIPGVSCGGMGESNKNDSPSMNPCPVGSDGWCQTATQKLFAARELGMFSPNCGWEETGISRASQPCLEAATLHLPGPGSPGELEAATGWCRRHKGLFLVLFHQAGLQQLLPSQPSSCFPEAAGGFASAQLYSALGRVFPQLSSTFLGCSIKKAQHGLALNLKHRLQFHFFLE